MLMVPVFKIIMNHLLTMYCENNQEKAESCINNARPRSEGILC